MFDKKMVILCLAIFMLLGGTLMASNVSFSEDIDEEDTLCIPVGKFALGAPDGAQQTLAGVEFPHSRHMTYNCSTCHHKWKYHAIVDTCATSGCHDLTEAPADAIKDGKYTAEGIRYYKYAYHNLCRGCHRENNAAFLEREKQDRFGTEPLEALRNGPVGCVGCHPKE